MNPLSWLRIAGLAGAIITGAGLFYWLADKIGDSRELDVRMQGNQQEEVANEAARKGRNRARECHALGSDRLWNVAKERCEKLGGVPGAGGGAGNSDNATADR